MSESGPRPVPEDHLCLSLRNEYLMRLRNPSWEAVLHRLRTHQEEARQPIDFIRSGTIVWEGLFLHELCDGFPYYNDVEHANNSMLLQVFKAAIDAYPEALQIADSDGFYPLHLMSRGWDWNTEKLAAFKAVFYAYPEAASIRFRDYGSTYTTALHCLLDSRAHVPEKDEAVKILLDAHPEALRLPDSDGEYPLHAASRKQPHLVKLLLERFPQAADIRGYEMRTPLLEALLRGARFHDDELYGSARTLLEACPWASGMEDNADSVVEIDDDEQCLWPVGDALDYICVCYAKEIGVFDDEFANSTRGFHEEPVTYRDYIETNINFLAGTVDIRRRMLRDIEGAFDLLIMILRVMYGKSQFLPLHAAVHGRLCRPWNLVAMKKILQRYGDEAGEKDGDGNLPIHLFLKSCMIEQERAVNRGYAKNAETYQDAVARCLRMLLDANPQAASTASGEGRLPLYLAIENASFSYDGMIAPLLELHPEALLARDATTTLHPFALAAAGPSSNLDLVFTLLRKDPSVVMEFTRNKARHHISNVDPGRQGHATKHEN